MHGGHGYSLIILLTGMEMTKMKKKLQVPLEVLIEKPVEDGIHAGGDHGSEVANQEQQVVAAGSNRQNFMIPIKHDVEDGERQPANCKCDHY